MKRVVHRVAIEGEYYAAIQRMVRCYTTLEHYANHKVNGHNCGLAWKPAIAVTPLATVRNAISEAMNGYTQVTVMCEDLHVARDSRMMGLNERAYR